MALLLPPESRRTIHGIPSGRERTMTREQLLRACDHEVAALLPDVPRPEQKALAASVCGVVLAEHAQLSRASSAMPSAAQDRSKQRRLQRLLANERLVLARAQRRLLARVLTGRGGRVDLPLDAPTTGA